MGPPRERLLLMLLLLAWISDSVVGKAVRGDEAKKKLRVKTIKIPKLPKTTTEEAQTESWQNAELADSVPWNGTYYPKPTYDFDTGDIVFVDDGRENEQGASEVEESLPVEEPAEEQEQQQASEQVTIDTEQEYETGASEERPKKYSARYLEPKSEATDQKAHYEVAEPTVAETKHEGGGGGNSKSSKGSGEEHHADHHSSKGAKSEKDYKGEHHFHKGEKGHHDKEGHNGEYSDKKGTKKGHKEGGGHFESGEHGEKGSKEGKHADKEEYKKGHSTRGGHVVHKKDEYEKKHEFYDEHHEGGGGEKHGEFNEEHNASGGGHKKGGHKHGGESGHHKGKKGHYEKGGHHHEDKGHKKKAGHDKHHEHDEKYGKKEGHSSGKKWAYDSGDGGKGKGGHQHASASTKQEYATAAVKVAPRLLVPLQRDELQFGGSEHVPATELRPPPPPTITITQYRLPPAK